MKTTRRRFAEALGEAIAPKPKKPCGGCTACCHTIPVEEIGIGAFQRCPHERGFPYAAPGCAIYDRRPSSCRVWTCMWATEGWDDDLRPDRCGVIVDPTPEVMRMFTAETPENERERPCVQMWAAPGHEQDFKRQPVLALVLAALDKIGAVLWRYRGPDGKQIPIGICRMPDGTLGYSLPAEASFDLGTPAERYWRAQQLLPPDQRGMG